MKKKIFRYIGSITLIIILLSVAEGCKKQDDWLDVKRLQGDVTPQTVADFQAILDLNSNINNRLSSVGIFGTDLFYMTDVDFLATSQQQRNLYNWQVDSWAGTTSPDWNYLYSLMEYANIVLDGMPKLNSSQVGYNNVQGQAYFYRALSLYTLAQLFCKPYSKGSAGTDLGIPVRLSSDVNLLYGRGTLEQLYKQMISDATFAVNLLDASQINNRRPSKNAALGLLARVYLNMEDYPAAFNSANSALISNATLLDFNDNTLISKTSTYRFPANGINNPEIVFFGSQQSYTALVVQVSNKGSVDPTFYNSYDSNDLRKSLFYLSSSGNIKFVGCYTGTYSTFCGIATNEIYLIRAECYARAGNFSSAMADLNALLKKRYVTGTFTDLKATDADQALQLVLQERKKELPFTENIRWSDLRRLNHDPKFQVTLTRKISNVTYTLQPNDPKYVLPIPDGEIQFSGLPQNIR